MSGDLSFGASCERDLTLSKVWLCQQLPRRQWRRVVVLGSWYGNMGLVLRHQGVEFDQLVNIDLNPRYCRRNLRLYQLAQFDRPCEIINADCNHISLSGADLVINTSTNDIEPQGWFRHISPGTWVAIQSRNNQGPAGTAQRPGDIAEFSGYYPLQQRHYLGQLSLTNSQGPYERYQLIGIR